MSSNTQRLGEAVLARRHELELTQLEVWNSGGPSNTTLTTIENGQQTSLSRATARKLDKGLQWVEGSAKRVWEGGDPVPLEAVAGVPPEVLREVQNLSPTVRKWIEQATGGKLPASDEGGGVSAG